MTSRERVRTVFAGGLPDRVPINYEANPGIDAKLKAHFGLDPNDSEGLRQRLGVDFRAIHTPYVGPRLHAEVPDRMVDPQFGWHLREVRHASGSYWDYCDFPLQEADEAEVAAWPLPTADDFDFSRLEQDCAQHGAFALYHGNPGLACIMNTAGFLRGMGQTFIDLATDDPAGLLLIDRILALQLEVTKRALARIGHLIDFLWLGEDLGTQRGPLISRDLFLRHILPRHEPFFALAREYGLPVMMHTCGSSSWAYEDYIKIGLKAADTLQPEAAGMDAATLKRQFGGRLVLHGGISTAGPVAFGTVEETVADVKEKLAVMMPGGGYCFSPTHALQDNSPLENVLAMYETAHQYGDYPR
jgi:uroporphyrinogen decarboxylase